MIWVIEKPLFIVEDEIILINLIKNLLGDKRKPTNDLFLQ
jgi:hypothetical protein